MLVRIVAPRNPRRSVDRHRLLVPTRLPLSHWYGIPGPTSLGPCRTFYVESGFVRVRSTKTYTRLILMAPKKLTKAKSLQFPFSTKRLYSNTTAKPHAVALGLTDKEAILIESSTSPSVSSHVSGTTRRKNLGKNGSSPPGARSQANTSIRAVHEQLPDTQSDQPYIPLQRRRCAKSRPLSFSGESPTPAVQSEMPPPPFPPLRHSERTSEGKALLLVVPLDIKIGADQSRGTKRSAAISAQSSDEAPKRDLSEPGPRKMVTRRVARFAFLRREKQHRQVDDFLETAEIAQEELWVAVGEDRCKPCKLVGREVCKPQWDASAPLVPCKSCVFCTGKIWSCNPPGSFLVNAGVPLTKLARQKTHQGGTPAFVPHLSLLLTPSHHAAVSTDDTAPIEVGKSSETAVNAAPPTTEVEARVEVVRRQSGREKSGKVAQASSDNDDRLVRIETHPSSIERQPEGLGAIQLAQQERKRMLVGMRRHQGFTPSLRSGFSAASSTRPLVPSSLAYSLSIKNAWRGSPYLNVGGPSLNYRCSAPVDAGTSGDYPANALPKSLVGRRHTQGQAQGSANSRPNWKMIREMLSRVKRDMEEARTELAAIDDRLAIAFMELRAICDDLG
ncbi:hypothetical protein EDB84DRAFT_1513382 [Lactarius hengduanensis]|nr:hypothetical protein EDB84DRAFT_1513382 [Lactarius hengduanensis]